MGVGTHWGHMDRDGDTRMGMGTLWGHTDGDRDMLGTHGWGWGHFGDTLTGMGTRWGHTDGDGVTLGTHGWGWGTQWGHVVDMGTCGAQWGRTEQCLQAVEGDPNDAVGDVDGAVPTHNRLQQPQTAAPPVGYTPLRPTGTTYRPIETPNPPHRDPKAAPQRPTISMRSQ